MTNKDTVSAKINFVNHYENNKNIYNIFLLFLMSRILFYLFYFSINAISVIEYDGGSVYLQYDGQHYYNIASSGYTEDYQYAFFPLFPLVIRVLDFFYLGIPGAIILNHALTLASAYLIYNIGLHIMQKSESECFSIARLWIFSPVAISTCLLYSEALFVFLTLIAFYSYKNSRHFCAGVALGLAIATRSLGATLYFAIFIAMAIKLYRSRTRVDFLAIARLYLPATTIALAYPIYLLFKEGNWHYFIDVQFIYWNRVSTNFLETILQDFSMIAHPSVTLIFTYISLAICCYIIYNAIKTKEDAALIIYLILTILFVFSTKKDLDSMASASFYRYLFGCSAVYLLVNHNLKIKFISIISLLLCICAITFMCAGAFLI